MSEKTYFHKDKDKNGRVIYKLVKDGKPAGEKNTRKQAKEWFDAQHVVTEKTYKWITPFCSTKSLAHQKALNESRIIPVVHPTTNQSAVLAKIASAPTPKLAASNISDSPNLAAARDMLQKMGLITLNDEGAFLTDQGKEVMVNQNLMDPSGGLTQDGQNLANDGKQGPPQPAPGADLDVGMDMGTDIGGDVGGAGETSDKGDVSLDLDLDDDSGDEKEDDKPKMRAKDQAPEEKMESFKLLPTLRHQAIVESLSRVPSDLLASLTDEEQVALRRALDGHQNLSSHEGLMSKLYDYYRAEMPYGTAKARTGDPEEWLLGKLS